MKQVKKLKQFSLHEMEAVVSNSSVILSGVPEAIARGAEKIVSQAMAGANTLKSELAEISNNRHLTDEGKHSESLKLGKAFKEHLLQTKSNNSYQENKGLLLELIKGKIPQYRPDNVADQVKSLRDSMFLSNMSQEGILEGITNGDPEFLQAVKSMPSYTITDPLLKEAVDKIEDTQMQAADPEVYQKIQHIDTVESYVDTIINGLIGNVEFSIPPTESATPDVIEVGISVGEIK